MGGDSPGSDDLRRAVRYARSQPDLHDSGSGNGRSARVRDGASGLGEITYKGRYGYRLVNRKGRGGFAERNRAHGWLQNLGLNVGAAEKFVPQIVFTAPEPSVRLFLQALFSGDGSIYHSDRGFFLEYYSSHGG